MALDPDRHQPEARSKRPGSAAAPTRRSQRNLTPVPAVPALSKKQQNQAQPLAHQEEATPPPDALPCARPVTPPAPSKAPPPQPAMERLATFLESALAAAVTMEDASPMQNQYPERITATLAALVKRLTPPASEAPSETAPLRPQILEAPSPPSEPPEATPSSNQPSPSAHTGSPPSQSPKPPLMHRSPTRLSPGLPRPHTSPLPDARFASHVTLRFPKHEQPIHLKIPHREIIDQLNSRCPHASAVPGQSGFAGLRWTPNGNLTIHMRGSYTAQNARDEAKTIESIIQKACNPPLQPCLELDDPWFGIVVHHVPTPCLARSIDYSSMRLGIDVCQSLDILSSQLKDIRLLCPNGEFRNAEHVSMRLMLTDDAVITRILDTGMNLFGHNLRTSRYRPRPRRQGPD